MICENKGIQHQSNTERNDSILPCRVCLYWDKRACIVSFLFLIFLAATYNTYNGNVWFLQWKIPTIGSAAMVHMFVTSFATSSFSRRKCLSYNEATTSRIRLSENFRWDCSGPMAANRVIQPLLSMGRFSHKPQNLRENQGKSNLWSAFMLDDDTRSNSAEELPKRSKPTTPPSSISEFSFYDEATVFVRGGSGGQGCSTYKRGLVGQDGKPDGGNGGEGGNVVLIVDASLNTLVGLNSGAWRPNAFGGSGAATSVTNAGKTGSRNGIGSWNVRPMSFRAENGRDGERRFKNGRRGNDVIIRVPPGTVVHEIISVTSQKDDTNNSSITYDSCDTKHQTQPNVEEVTYKKHIVNLPTREDLIRAAANTEGTTKENDDAPSFIVAFGGKGGQGSGVLGRSSRGIRRPRISSTGGERKLIHFTLNLVADVCLVGVPNSGKSTFLAAVTRAKPKIADYPFTTIVPNLGVWVSPEHPSLSDDSSGGGSEGLVLCDVPGLIAGASLGVGLGHAFLRHVERCRVIVHIVDATSADPIGDYLMINNEISYYSSSYYDDSSSEYGKSKLATIPQVVVVNKIDTFQDNDYYHNEEQSSISRKKKELETKLTAVMPHSRLLWVSAKNKDGVDDVMKRLASFVKKVKAVG